MTNCNATEPIEEIAIKLYDTFLSSVLHTATWKAQGWLWVFLNWVKPQLHFPFGISSRQLQCFKPRTGFHSTFSVFSCWSYFIWYCRHYTSASTGVSLLQNFLQNQWVWFCLWSFIHTSWQDRHWFTHIFSQIQLIWGPDCSPSCWPVLSHFRKVILSLEH